MKTPKMTVLAAFLLSSMAVNAEIISISYTDQQGEHQDAPLTQKFFSPKGNTVISFSSGLDRRMRMTVKNPGG
ncbi:DUF4165 domain-containing protein (plasmid) [Photobacterium damselae]